MVAGVVAVVGTALVDLRLDVVIVGPAVVVVLLVVVGDAAAVPGTHWA